MRVIALFAFLAACAGAQEAPPGEPAAPKPAQDGFTLNLPVEEFVLDNGMKVLMVERRQSPRVYCALYWKVGSANEGPGITGLSHFFEHMMFKGTKKLGTRDGKKDAEYNAAIEEVMGEVRLLKLRGREGQRRGETLSEDAAKTSTTILKGDEARWKELLAKFDELTKAQQEITISEHIAKLFEGAGGTEVNATTSFDSTRYYAELPANKVELFFWVESETFLGPVWREFYQERDVVKEERRMRYEATPAGLIFQEFHSMFWEGTPYAWPTIGWMQDIDLYTVAEAQRYYDTYYQPQNCTAIFVGDIDREQIRDLCRRYFGRLKPREVKGQPITPFEMTQAAERRMEAEAEGKPFVQIAWLGPAGVHADSAALDLLTMTLDGRTGRLWRSLVDEKKLALEAGGGFWSPKYGGMLHMEAVPRDQKQLPELEAAIYEVLKEVQEKGVTERELQKVKNQTLAFIVRELDTYSGIGDMLGAYEVSGEWRDLHTYVKQVEKVTVEDVKRAANEYFPPSGRNVLVMKRVEKKP